MNINIRQIKKEDDLILGEVIRGCFLDYDANQTGTVFADKVIDQLSVSFSGERSAYFVLEEDGVIMGGAGIQALKGESQDICELQKMYIRKEARGRGLGKTLLEKCIEFAREESFKTCYLESLPELKDALKMYERNGFNYIDHRMGNTGYFGCTLFMKLTL
ncbi:MAG: GNAT family N-acetyltransferase [Bacteroidales bacterium]|jgi:putative acetyltransferase|nr:GNAT family N-acetyltransferase [Bacteroidales bacterium]